MASAPLSIESRRVPRDIVSFRAPLEGATGIRISVLMVDLSPLGFMSRTSAVLTAGEVVAVQLPAIGNRAARIVWSLGGRVGGEFLECIDQASYARVLANAPTDRPAWDEF